MLRANPNPKDCRSRSHIKCRRREHPKTAEKTRSGDYENQNFWGLEENFSLQFHQLLAKSHPVRLDELPLRNTKRTVKKVTSR